MAVCGCGGGQTRDSAHLNGCKKSMKDFADAYSAGSAEKACEFVSESFRGGRAKFLERLKSEAVDAQILTFNYWVETATSDADAVFIDAKWEKKALFRMTGSQEIQRGRASLQFKIEKDRWMLFNVTGDDPFGTAVATADLQVVSATISAGSHPDPVTATVIVKNGGRNHAMNYEVRLMIDGIPAGADQVSSIAPGSQESFQWIGIPSPGSGSHTVTVIVDPSKRILETDRNNNRYETTFSR